MIRETHNVNISNKSNFSKWFAYGKYKEDWAIYLDDPKEIKGEQQQYADAAQGTASVIADWPTAAVAGCAAYPGPVVWLRGGESEYITDADVETMRTYFPRVRQVTVKGAGHWVHADRPGVVVETITRLLRAPLSS